MTWLIDLFCVFVVIYFVYMKTEPLENDIWEVVSDEILKNKFKDKIMNIVNGTDVTLMSLALADFAGIAGFLSAHDYPVAGGLLVVGIVLVYLYHKYGSPSVPPQ